MTTALCPPAGSRSGSTPDAKLEVRSTSFDFAEGLLEQLPGVAGGLAWVRGGEGIVGWGEVARLEVYGPDRFVRAQRWWREVTDRFVIDDQVDVAGSGPIAFASFAFDDASAEASVVVVPQVVIGRRDGVGWLTTIGVPSPTVRQPVTAPGALRYSAGQMSAEAFQEAVAEAVRHIAAGRLAKVVLAHDLLATADRPIDPRHLLRRLAARYPGCWTFAVDGLVGATPELLVALHDGQVSARVLAGTTARSADEVEDHRRRQALLASAKDQVEHRYAAQSLLTTLRPVCAALSDPGEPYLLELSNVAHLATDVRARVAPGHDVLDLVRAVHPTAAVGGTPTRDAVALIRALESMDRGRYTGPVGWMDAGGDGEWGIALRCAALDNDTARLFAGCGIVADSDPVAEAAEAQAKLVPVREALGDTPA